LTEILSFSKKIVHGVRFKKNTKFCHLLSRGGSHEY
jgi:hypothetical protein